MSIFAFIFPDVDDVLNSVRQALDGIENIRNELENAVNAVIGVEWLGKGADAFQNEVLTRLIPQIVELVAAIGGIQLNITKSYDRVTQGDDDGVKCIDNLNDVYNQIQI